MRVVCFHLLVFYEQTGCIAATKLVWTVVILNGSEASGHLQMYGELTFFEAKRVVRVNSLKLPPSPPMGLDSS